jgi:ElaB/YqjD/DUF883 family membrane-anchored ribosome-binding protein
MNSVIAHVRQGEFSVTTQDSPNSNNMGDEAQNPVNKAKETIQQTAKEIADEAAKAAENAQQTIGKARENVQHTVSQVGTDATRSAAEARRAMRESAYTVKETASDQLLTAAESIRREALKGGNEEVIRQAHTLARSMEKAALYLDGHTFEQIGQDATEVVKENPWQSVGIVFFFGLLMGLLFGGGGNRD